MKTCRVGLFGCALSVCVAALGAEYTYNVGVDGETMAVGDIPKDATAITKTGPGVLTFTGNGGNFAGKFIVEEGAVKAEANAFAVGSSVEVKSGATWDMAGGGTQWVNPSPAVFSIAGAGGANGYAAAFVRSSGTTVQASGSSLTLTADATILFTKNHNPGTINLNGYRLTKKGGGQFLTYGPTNIHPGGETGEMELLEGNYLLTQAGYTYDTAGVTTNNVLRFGSAHTFNVYPMSGKRSFYWALDLAATLQLYAAGSDAISLAWKGPVTFAGGGLKFAEKNAGMCSFAVDGDVTATGAGDIEHAGAGAATINGSVDINGRIVNSSGGTMTFNGPVSAGWVLGNGAGSIIFTNDVVLAGGVTNAVGRTDPVKCGTIVFRGDVTQSDPSAISKNDRGLLRFEGCGRVEFAGPFGAPNDKGDTYGTQPTGTYEVVDVEYFRHPNYTRLSGTFEGPQSLFVSNSVWDCGNAFVIAGNNFSHGRVAYIDSIVTNCLWIGGGYGNDAYACRGSVWVCGSEMTIPARSESYRSPLSVADSSGGYGYLKLDGSTVSVQYANDIQFGYKGSAFVHAAGSTVTFKSTTEGSYVSMKSAQDADSTSGSAVFYLTSGSVFRAYQFVFGSGIVAVEGPGTVLSTTELTRVRPLAGPLTLALNDGGSIDRAFTRLSSDGNGIPWYLSIDGGILSPRWRGEFFGDVSTAPTSFVVGEKGVVVDTSSNSAETEDQATTFCMPMTAPVGKVVSAISLPTDEAYAASTYFGPAKVTISGTGSGAAAIALYDFAQRRITGIKVVACGTGYDDSTTATIASANGTSSYECAVTVADAPVTGRGLVKRGANCLKLTQPNTYKGPTTVEGGTLYANADSLPEGSALVILEGGTLDLRGDTVEAPSLSGGGTLSDGTVVAPRLDLTTASRMTISSDATLRLTDGAEITLTGDLAELDDTKRYRLVTGRIECGASVALPDLADNWKIVLGDNGVTLRRSKGMSVIIR